MGWAGRNFRFRICVSLTHVGSRLEMWNCLFSVQIGLRRFRRFEAIFFWWFLGHQITTRTAYYYWLNVFLLQIFFSCKKSTSHFYLLIFHIQRVRFWLKEAERWKLSWAPSAKGWPRACHSQRAGFWTSCCGCCGSPPPLRVSLALAIVESKVAVEISIDVAVCSKAASYPMVWLSISLCLGSRRCSSKGNKEKN